MTAPLHRLFNLFELHEAKIFDDEALIKTLVEKSWDDNQPSLIDELLEAWRIYEKGMGKVSAEEAFFGKPVRSVGNYSARLSRMAENQEREVIFMDLLYFEKYPEKFAQDTTRERLMALLLSSSVDSNGKEVTRWYKPTETDMSSLERQFREHKKTHHLPKRRIEAES